MGARPPIDVTPDVLTDRLVLDIETGSALNLKNVTADVYAEHDSTQVWCVVFGLMRPDGTLPVLRWAPGAPFPEFLADYLTSGGTVVAWNVGFERAIWRHILTPQFRWPPVPAAQWVDAQAYSACLSLPLGLGKAAAALVGVKDAKDLDGARLMKKLAVVTSDGEGGWDLPDLMTEANFGRLLDYCEQDVATTASLLRNLLRPSIHEHHVWLEDQAINQRGICLDVDRAARMARLAAAREAELEAHVGDATATALAGVKGVPKLKAWLGCRGVVDPTASLTADVVTELLVSREMPADVRVVLETRLEVGKLTSLAKLKRLKDVVSSDGRARGLLRYHGAHTGRWSSTGLQVHNLRKDRRSPELRALCASAIDAEDLDLLSMLDAPLDALSAALRSLIVSAPGHDLISADLMSIEACVLPWLANDAPKVAFLHRYIAGHEKLDLYERTAASIGSKNRQLGKVCELALGFGMGPLKFIDQAKKLGKVVLGRIEARKVQRAWRAANERTVDFWSDLEMAFRRVIRKNGTEQTVGRLRLRSAAGGSVTISLPSGRKLWYHRAHEVKRDRQVPVLRADGTIELVTFDTPSIVYSTATAGGMMQVDTYGGKLAENVTQAVARDCLAEGLLTLRDTDYDVVLHVHDCIVAEVPTGTGDVAEFEKLMCQMPKWADGLPIAASGYRAKRFRG